MTGSPQKEFSNYELCGNYQSFKGQASLTHKRGRVGRCAPAAAYASLPSPPQPPLHPPNRRILNNGFAATNGGLRPLGTTGEYEQGRPYKENHEWEQGASQCSWKNRIPSAPYLLRSIVRIYSYRKLTISTTGTTSYICDRSHIE